jgi:hypothetical protein
MPPLPVIILRMPSTHPPPPPPAQAQTPARGAVLLVAAAKSVVTSVRPAQIVSKLEPTAFFPHPAVPRASQNAPPMRSFFPAYVASKASSSI